MTSLEEKESLLEAAGFEKEFMGPFFAAYSLHLTDEIEITVEIEEEPVGFCLYNGDEVIRSIEPYEDEPFEETLKRALRSGNNLKKKIAKGD
jgi:hypothetical protein